MDLFPVLVTFGYVDLYLLCLYGCYGVIMLLASLDACAHTCYLFFLIMTKRGRKLVVVVIDYLLLLIQELYVLLIQELYARSEGE